MPQPVTVSQRLAEFRERLVDAPARARVMATVANRSGLLWEVNARGALAMLATLASGRQHPTELYRIYAANSPDKPALVWRDQSLTFGELDARIDRLATGLGARGFGRRSSLVLMLKNRPEFIELQAAAGRVGGAAVSVSWRSTPQELAFLVSHSGSKMIFFEQELWPTVEQALRSLPQISKKDCVPLGGEIPGTSTFDSLVADHVVLPKQKGLEEEAAVVIYTSGTTGKPKGAVRKFQKDALPAALRFVAETPMRTDDVHLVTSPMYHSTAFGFVALSHMLGATIVIMEEFKPELFLRDVEKHHVTTTALVPTMLHRILALDESIRRRYRTRSLRAIFSGGAPLPGPLAIEAMDTFGDVLFNFYGATETGLVTLAKPQDLRAAPGTIGKAVPGNEIQLLDDQGRRVPRGQVGELYVKNKLLVEGYHHDDAATAASMKNGFFSVGDLAREDRDGRYFIEGRKRDMIISGGVNVYPAEVEGVLETHPELAEVAVVGVDDPEWGERVRAFVVRRPGSHVDEGSLKTWTRERLAGPKVPRDFVFVEALPRNPTGKVLKRELKTWSS